MFKEIYCIACSAEAQEGEAFVWKVEWSDPYAPPCKIKIKILLLKINHSTLGVILHC